MSTKKPAAFYNATGFDRNQIGFGEFGRMVSLKPANQEAHQRLVN